MALSLARTKEGAAHMYHFLVNPSSCSGRGGRYWELVKKTLEEKGIYVSSGSACSSNHPAVSGVLKGIGAAREYLDATLRFSMSEFTTKEEIDYTLETLYNCVPMLRKYTRH